MKNAGQIENASPRPWRVEYVTRQRDAYIKAADNAVVTICHADNAELIVAAVNEFNCAIAPHGRKPNAQSVEIATDLQAASDDHEMGSKSTNTDERHPCPTKRAATPTAAPGSRLSLNGAPHE